MTASVALPSRRSLATGFAEDVFGGGEVEDVVDDLEGEAEVAAVFSELRLDLLMVAEAVRGRDRSAELHGDLEETGGLAEDEVEVLLFVDEMAELLHLQQLAFDHLLGERDQQLEHAEVALFQRRTEGLHVEPVAGEDALGVAPGRVRRRAAAAGVGLVDDVVVDERRGVQHLDDGAEADAAWAGAAEGFGREQEQQRADAFAAACDEIPRDVGDDLDVGGGLAVEVLLDGREVVAEEVEDFGCGRDGEGAHLIVRVSG